MEITYQEVSFQDVIDGIQIKDDCYGLAKECFSEARKAAFLSNPFLIDKTTTMVLLARVDGVVCGKRMFFPTRIYASGEEIQAFGGSNYYVHQDYRKYALGGALILYAAKKKNNFLLSAGCSNNSIKIYEALKGSVFYIPSFKQVRRSIFLIDRTSVKSFAFSLLDSVKSFFLYPFVIIARISNGKYRMRYEVTQLKTVPQWIEDMVKNDGHKYMELHNKDWFEWNLNNSFAKDPYDVQKLFSVYDNKKPVGFFLIKERKVGKKVIGSLMEWQTADETRLSEVDIVRLAMMYFSKNVMEVIISSLDQQVQLYCGVKHGFVVSRSQNIVCKDLKKQYPDSSDISNWRIRPGYADVIMSK